MYLLFKVTLKLIQPKSNRPNTSIINASIKSVFVVIGTKCVPTAIDIIVKCVIIGGIIKTAFIIVKIVTPDDITTDANIIVMADVTTNAAK